MEKWKIAAAKVQGQQHIKNKIPCQDAFAYIEKMHFFCSAVSDGAGSARYAQLASELVTEKIIKILEKGFDDFYINSNLEIKIKIIHNLRTYLGINASNQKAKINDFNCTLMFVAIKDNKYIAGHIGDGAIGVIKNDDFFTLSVPLNGEFKNQTYFVTSSDYQNHFRIYKGELNDISGFLLATDGTTDSLYNYITNEFAKISKDIIKWLDKNDNDKVSKALQENLEKVVSKKTSDDCTLLVMRKDVIENKMS